MFLKNLQKTSVKLCSFRRLSKFPLGSQIFDNERPKNSIFYGYRLDSELKTVQDLNNPVVSTAGNDLLLILKLAKTLETQKILSPKKIVAAFAENTVLTPILSIVCWLNNCTFVPLSEKYPDNDINYFLEDSKADIFISSKNLTERAEKLAEGREIEFYEFDYDAILRSSEEMVEVNYDDILGSASKSDDDAIIFYTSGTTGRPKGALHTHQSISNQVNMLLTAWEWSENDSILHILPLHHVHGFINAMLCPLAAGADIHMLSGKKAASAKTIWSSLELLDVNTFMAVPTIYSRLVNFEDHKIYSDKIDFEKKFRLLVSGSAALPNPVFEKFKDISGVELLERYGMTEFCMGISNKLHEKRQAGYVGLELPGVEVRLLTVGDENDEEAENMNTGNIVYQTHLRESYDKKTLKDKPLTGHLLIKTPGIFTKYLNKQQATKETFDNENWFITGDTASYDGIGFKILGRNSTDIIKSGGYKISALEIEAKILEANGHLINEVAVVSTECPDLGEKIVAIVVFRDDSELSENDAESVLKFENLVNYQKPRKILVSDKPLERNVMGKLNKKLMKRQFGL